MPSRSISRHDGALPGVVKATIAASPSVPKPNSSASRAASSAKPARRCAGRDAPADLDRRGEARLPGYRHQPDHADEGRAAAFLDHPEAPAMGVDMRLHAGGPGIAFGARHHRRKVPHAVRIAIDGEERVEILGAPGAKGQARALQSAHHHAGELHRMCMRESPGGCDAGR